MADLTGAAATSYPQIGANLSIDEMAKQLAGHTGGAERPKRLQRAVESIQEAVGSFNEWAWSFNRVVDDIALATLVSGETFHYALTTDWRNPFLALLLDSSGNKRGEVEWKPYTRWEHSSSQTASGGRPVSYSARNIHETGVIFVNPPLDTSNLTYPTMRLVYHRWIVFPAHNKAINVPRNVSNAIMQLARYFFLLKDRGVKAAAAYEKIANRARLFLEQEYREWPDFGPDGGNE